jgi:hypothetical protein
MQEGLRESPKTGMIRQLNGVSEGVKSVILLCH